MSDALAGNETVVDNQDARRTGQAHAYHALATVFAQGFRFLATINGVGVLLTLFCAVGVLQTNLMPALFRIPLAVFIGGLALCGVGLLWSYLVQTSLFGQRIDGRRRRTHWVPMICRSEERRVGKGGGSTMKS